MDDHLTTSFMIAFIRFSCNVGYPKILLPDEGSPSGPLSVSGKPDKILESNFEIFKTWFECGMISNVPRLMDQPKWFNSDGDVKVGDIILFKKSDIQELINMELLSH